MKGLPKASLCPNPAANTGIVNHTHSRMGSIMSTGIVQGKNPDPKKQKTNPKLPQNPSVTPPVPPPGSSSGQSGTGSSTHYPLNSQFTMGGPPISMASPMSITTNTMHYGS